MPTIIRSISDPALVALLKRGALVYSQQIPCMDLLLGHPMSRQLVDSTRSKIVRFTLGR